VRAVARGGGTLQSRLGFGRVGGFVAGGYRGRGGGGGNGGGRRQGGGSAASATGGRRGRRGWLVGKRWRWSSREEVVAGRKTTEAGRGSVARGRRMQRGHAVALTLG
jgi:hypothetical protein